MATIFATSIAVTLSHGDGSFPHYVPQGRIGDTHRVPVLWHGAEPARRVGGDEVRTGITSNLPVPGVPNLALPAKSTAIGSAADLRRGLLSWLAATYAEITGICCGALLSGLGRTGSAISRPFVCHRTERLFSSATFSDWIHSSFLFLPNLEKTP